MSNFLRLLTIAVIGFVIVGVAIAYTRDSGLPEQFGAVSTGVMPIQLQFPTANAGAAGEQDRRVWIPRRSSNKWIGLAGFPDSAEVRFAIPAGISFSSGSLDLKFDIQMGNDGDGRLTIAVNGQRRGEVVLDSGRSRRDVRIHLDADDLLGKAVNVTLEGRGTLSGGQICPVSATNSGSAITLLPESGLELVTSDPKDSIAAHVATLADPMTLAPGRTVEDQAVSLWTLQALKRRGATVRLANSDMAADLVAAPAGETALALDSQNRLAISGAAGVESLLSHRRPADPVRKGAISWPIPAKALGAEVLVKDFRGSRRWIIPYKLADLKHGHMPGLLKLQFKTSLLAPGNQWIMRTSLNGNLIRTERFDGQKDVISMVVPLHEDAQKLDNTIIVELIDTSPKETVCSVPPKAQAQLLPSTMITQRTVQPDRGWPEMVRALADMDSIGLSVATPLNRAQQATAAAALSRFLPINADMAFAPDALAAPVTIEVTTGAKLRSDLYAPKAVNGLRLTNAAAGGHWLVIPGRGVGPALLPRAEPRAAAVIEQLDDDAVVLTIRR